MPTQFKAHQEDSETLVVATPEAKVVIKHTHEGIIVDVWHPAMETESAATCAATFVEIEESNQ